MRYILNELRMVVCSRKLIACFFLFLAMNAGLLLVSFDTGEIDAAEYMRIKKEMLVQPEYIEDIYEGDSEEQTVQTLYDEYLACSDYESYLETVLADAKEHTSISIFQTAFSMSNLKQTETDFAKLAGTEPKFVGGYGLCKAMNFAGSYILVLFLVVILAFELVLRDKKNGLASLYKTTWHGDARLLLSKYVAGVCYMTLYIVGVFACNFAVSRWKFGAVDLSAPVQSLSSYTGYGYVCSIGRFVLLAVLSKILIFLLVLSVLFLCVMISSNEVLCFVWVALCVFVELLLQFTGENMKQDFLRRLSVFEMLDTERFFSYLNYNLAGRAAAAISVDCFCICAGTVLMLVAASFVYNRGTNEYREGVPWLIKRKRVKRKKAVLSLWRLEGYKLWLGYRMIFVFVLFAVLQIYIYQNKAVRWSTNENSYRYYMNQIAGDITQEKLDYIVSEAARYQALHQEIDKLDSSFDAGLITQTQYDDRLNEINEQLQSEGGFLRCQEYVDYIKEQCEITDDISEADSEKLQGMGFVYSRGWNLLAGGTDYKEDMQNAAKLVVVLMLTAAFLYLEDYRYKINGILDIMKEYRKLRLIKAGTLACAILCAFLLTYLPDMIWVIRNIGLSGVDFKAISLPYLSNVAGDMSILEYFCMVYGIRLLTIFVMNGIYILVGKRIKHTNGAIFFAAVAALLPILLYLTGITGAGKYPLVSLLSGNMLLR